MVFLLLEPDLFEPVKCVWDPGEILDYSSLGNGLNYSVGTKPRVDLELGGGYDAVGVIDEAGYGQLKYRLLAFRGIVFAV